MHVELTCMHILIQSALDPPEQLSLSSSSPNSVMFKRYWQIQKCACTFMCIVLACMLIAHIAPEVQKSIWTLLSNFHFLHQPQTFHCLKAMDKPAWTFMRIALTCMHIFIYHSRRVKKFVSIRSTLLSNLNFLHQQILHCLKAINKYRNMHVHLCALCLHACTYRSRSAKVFCSIHCTLLSNFHLLHHSRILHCLKTITKHRNVHAPLCALYSHACTYHSQFFFGVSLIPLWYTYLVS